MITPDFLSSSLALQNELEVLELLTFPTATYMSNIRFIRYNTLQELPFAVHTTVSSLFYFFLLNFNIVR